EPAAVRDARAARTPRPAPAGKTTTPKPPPPTPPWTPARLGPFAPRWYRERMAQARREDPSPNEPEP
ncbi:MAG: hypothetical protein NZM07_00885, partial [Elioraea sp.]|nr:hypothetical protein [Elioraea sp.]